MILPMIIITILLAYSVAKLEINIEGKDGWAKNLPTYHFSNFATRLLTGKTEFTGYHLWLNNTILLFLHVPFFVGLPWTRAVELRILGFYFLAVILEDIFWFALNPAFGLKKLNKTYVTWHKWFWFVPRIYIFCAVMSLILIGLSLTV
jgi:hypothetical protein